MKRKLILSACIITSLLTGCSRGNIPGPEVSSEPTPSASTDMVQTEQSTPETIPDTTKKTMITEQEAQNIALSHAGLSAEQVNFIKSNIDMDDGHRNYDVEFYTKDGREYDYEIDPYSGQILDHDFDAEHYVQSSAVPQTTNPQEITSEAAKEIALARVPGATEQDIKGLQTEYDDGRLYYEGTIYYENMKYEFEIDGANGEIREWDVEGIYD